MDNYNNNNNNARMTAVCTEHAAPEAQHVADQRIKNAEITATGVGSRDQHADGKQRSAS